MPHKPAGQQGEFLAQEGAGLLCVELNPGRDLTGGAPRLDVTRALLLSHVCLDSIPSPVHVCPGKHPNERKSLFLQF